MENIDVTTELLNELELINYVNFDTALAIHHNLSELKSSIQSHKDVTDYMSLLGKELNATLKAKIEVLTKNIEIINRIIEKMHIRPFVNIGGNDVCMN